jgi:hypothetical protein
LLPRAIKPVLPEEAHVKLVVPMMDKVGEVARDQYTLSREDILDAVFE